MIKAYFGKLIWQWVSARWERRDMETSYKPDVERRNWEVGRWGKKL